MKLDDNRLEALQVIFAGADDGVNIHLKGKKTTDEGYYLCKDNIFYHEKDLPDGEGAEFQDTSRADILNEIRDKELVVYYATGWKGNQEDYQTFDDWKHLSEYLGINKMVTLGVKVPEIISRRFDYFSTKASNRSTVLRELIINYLKTQISDNSLEVIYDHDF